MESIWFVVVAFMLTAYVVLDGFDLGAGALHLVATRTEEERQQVLAAIGPVWNGNEVWLIAAGGTLFLAFPLLYAASFSGFYLGLNIVVWLLIFRAIGIEFRLHLQNTLWRLFFDGCFSLASILLIVFLGAALGNVLRGVPLRADHYFFLPLWTNFRPGPEPGLLDWYTVLCAVTALAVLTEHGALYVILKTGGALNGRMSLMARRLWPLLVVLSGAALLATVRVHPQLLNNYRVQPTGWIIPALLAAALAGMFQFTRTGHEQAAFLSSCGYIVAALAGAAFALYPALLNASGDPAYNLTIQNSAAPAGSLSSALIWWGLGMVIAIGYFVVVYTLAKGKVSA